MPDFSRREFLAATAAAPLAAQFGALADGPIRVLFPGEAPRTLHPGATHEAFGARITEFPAAGPLTIRQIVTDRSGVLERTFEVTSTADTAFNLEVPYEFPASSRFFSWLREEKQPVDITHEGFEAPRPHESRQLFPFAGALQDGRLTGVLADCPGFWENRSVQSIDPAAGRIVIQTGDGSPLRKTAGVKDYDHSVYHTEYDGWQHIRNRELRSFKTWLFTAPAANLYAVQLAAHRALARAKGWSGSPLTEILRNTSYLLIRRNLVRPESRYLIASGVSYGWHQWVDDMGMAGLALPDTELLAEGCRAAYLARCLYEDNGQWYLILSALIARAGYRPNRDQCRRVLEFLRDHEKDGAYVPPGGVNAPAPLGWKSYMDLFFYADGDAPSSNQGFHCGAMLGARELGFAVTEADVTRTRRAYARMFNHDGGYLPTSAQRPEVFGGDALYGEAISYAAFGAPALPGDLVLRHCRHATKIQSPYGIRVVSKADGALLDANQYGPNNPYGLPPDRAGAYVQGGSWFFCDAGTWLAGLVHGLDRTTVDRLLIKRIQAELARVPAFNESINTRTGEPHGNILYSANSVYAWLRPTIRKRLGHTGPDPVEASIAQYLASR